MWETWHKNCKREIRIETGRETPGLIHRHLAVGFNKLHLGQQQGNRRLPGCWSLCTFRPGSLRLRVARASVNESHWTKNACIFNISVTTWRSKPVMTTILHSAKHEPQGLNTIGLDDRRIRVRIPKHICRLWGPPSLIFNGYKGCVLGGGGGVNFTTP
jgi:hypothetical protein